MGRTVATVVGVVAAIAIAVVAPPLGAALAGALAISTAVATALVTVGLSLALGIGMKALGLTQGAPRTPVGPPAVFRQSVSDSFIVYGQRRVGGLMVFFHPRQDGDDHYRYFVIACAGHRCESLVSFMLNDEIVTVDGSSMVTSGPYAGAAWLWFQTGEDSETANATFVSECGGKWTNDHKGNNVAAIYAKFEMTEDVVQAGMPNITAIIEGKNDIADPRGPSVGYTNNAALVFYDWLALPREEGGFGAYADEIPEDAWIIAQANVCDETVESEARYALDGVIVTGAAPNEIRDVMVVNCAGTYTYSGGVHLMRPGYWVPVSETLSEDDLAGPIQVSAFLAGDQTANEVQGTYVEPDDGYLAAPIATQTIGAADIRQLSLDLAFVTSKFRAERIASIMLKRAQAEKTVIWPMNIEGLKTQALDTVALDTSRYGLSNYAFTVAGWSLSADYGVILSLREENEDIYGEPTPVAAPSIPTIGVAPPLGGPVDPSTIPSLESPTITTPTIAGALDLQGGQITFPATQVPSADPNTLDDYEEGTFTPNLLFGGAATGMTYHATGRQGRYTKIGRLVFVTIRVVLTAKGTSTGAATITGLPFTSAASPGDVPAIVMGNMTTVAVPAGTVAIGGTTLSLFDYSGSALTALTDADFTNTSLVLLTFSYSV